METNTAKMARTDQSKVLEPGIGDRLSSLPDELISEILSFLETKFAVGTAVLSRRWADLWTRVSNLDLDNRLVYRYMISRSEAGKLLLKEMEEKRASEFTRFVDRVLSQHKNLDSLRRFRFHFSVSEHNWKAMQDYLDKGEMAFGSQLEEIDISLTGAAAFGGPRCIWRLPESFYTLKNLKVVKLDGVVMAANGSVSLPCLKILKLWKVEIKDFETLNRLISDCPVLETLCLEYCTLVDINEEDVVTASMPSLRNLRISGCLDDFHDLDLCPIQIEAPKLEHLYLENFTYLQFLGSSNPVPCLHSARFDTSDRGSSYDYLIWLLAQISNAKELHLYRNTLELLSAGDDVRQLVFPNLTHLTVEPTQRSSSRILHSLLHSAPKLQHLFINVVTLWMAIEPMMWEETEPASTPQCLLSSLEEIEIKGLEPVQIDMKMVGYLLSVGAVLKKVDVDLVSADTKRERMELRSLLKLPRESSACDVRLLLCEGEIDSNIDDVEINADDKDKIDLDDENEDGSHC